MEDTDTTKLFTIKVEENGRFDKRMPVAVNGNVTHLPIGEEVEVGQHIIDALTNADVKFTVLSPEGEGTGAGSDGVGSAPASTATDTVTRLDPANAPVEGDDADALVVAEPLLAGEGDGANTGANTGTDTGGGTDAETAPAKKAPAKAAAKAPAKKAAAKK